MAATMHYMFEPGERSADEFPVRGVVRKRVEQFYKNATREGSFPKEIYALIMEETECPMLEATMEFTGNNQSRSARILGLNRGTFRKKLEQYGMLNSKTVLDQV